MRIALALALFALPAAASLPVAAQASDRVEDRYGPPPPRHSAAVSYPTPATAAKDEAAARDEAASYRGPYLSWTGKGGARQPVQTAAAVAPRPAPAPQPRFEARYAPAAAPVPAQLLPQSLYGRPANAPAPPPSRPAPPVQAAAEPAPAAMLPRRTQMAVSSPVLARAPVVARTSPTPPSTAAARAPVAVATKAAPTSTPTAAPTQVAPTQVAPTQVAMATPPPGPPATPVKARFYSLHRDYGDAPDPVTLPAARPPVLVGPADTATAPQSSNSDDHGEGGSGKPTPPPGAPF